ncbi:nucleotidyltransferase family protein [Sphingopyxis panaciterrae]
MNDAGDIAAILLAAGQSRRFGGDDKLLVPLEGERLALHAARRIVELAPRRRIAVCHDGGGALAQALATLGFEIVVNAYPERGLSQSLSRGIAEVARGPETAALICLADMPFVTIGHLRNLLARFDPGGAPAVASTDGETPMPPALFARSLFDRLRASKGDRGGKALLAVAELVTANPDELADIDRPEDLRRV